MRMRNRSDVTDVHKARSYYRGGAGDGQQSKNLLKYRKMAVKKKGYFFHITGDKKDYVGFRKKSWNDETDIMYDLLEYFAEVPEEDKK